MIDLRDFEPIEDKECQGFRVKDQEVVSKKSKTERDGTIRMFLRSKENSEVFAALLKWTFVESGTSGSNYQLLSELEIKPD